MIIIKWNRNYFFDVVAYIAIISARHHHYFHVRGSGGSTKIYYLRVVVVVVVAGAESNGTKCKWWKERTHIGKLSILSAGGH
jgi:hypothetical protein